MKEPARYSGITSKGKEKKLLRTTLIQYMGSDTMVADSARVSTDRDREGRQIEGLIRYLAREKHMSPFESCAATFMVEAPLFVRDQWVRHRTQSYNSLSLRYTALKGDMPFYFPPADRPLVNEGSGAHPKFVEAPDEKMQENLIAMLMTSYSSAIDTYNELLEEGIAEEVARMVLPEGTMTRFYATANMRNWSAFVKERTAENAQWEIKQLANEISETMGELFPVSWAALLESK